MLVLEIHLEMIYQLYVIMFDTRTPPLVKLGVTVKSDWKGFGSMDVLFSSFPTYIVFKSAGKSRFIVYGIVVCM